MCKNSVKSAIPADNRENSNVNVGLLNMSSEKFGDGIFVEMIMHYVIAIICLAMVCKWLKKCWNRRQERQKRMLNLAGIQMNHLNNPGQGQQLGQQLALPAPAAPPMPAPAQPVPVPIIVHQAGGNQYKPAIMSTEFEKIEQYRTQT